jgi:hypothetical protein
MSNKRKLSAARENAHNQRSGTEVRGQYKPAMSTNLLATSFEIGAPIGKLWALTRPQVISLSNGRNGSA